MKIMEMALDGQNYQNTWDLGIQAMAPYFQVKHKYNPPYFILMNIVVLFLIFYFLYFLAFLCFLAFHFPIFLGFI